MKSACALRFKICICSRASQKARRCVESRPRHVDAHASSGQIVNVASLVTVSTRQPSAGISVAFDVEVTYTMRTGALSGRDTERVASFLRRLPQAKYFEILAEGRVFSKCRFSEPSRLSQLAFVHDGVSLLEEPSAEHAVPDVACERANVSESGARVSSSAPSAPPKAVPQFAAFCDHQPKLSESPR